LIVVNAVGDCAKADGTVAKLRTFAVDVPVFVSVTLWAALALPNPCEGKVRDEVETLIAAVVTTATPVNEIDADVPSLKKRPAVPL
jgi:hypothetical protein